MARKNRKQRHRHETHAEYINNNVHYLPQAQKQKQVHIHGRNPNQKDYIQKLLDPTQTIIFATGPAGTGKTMLAVLAAVKALKEQTIDRLIITRPAVGVDDEKHGFLPGDLNDKMKPWLRPIYDIFEKYVSHTYMERLIKEETIEVCPLAFMRGRTFENCIIIADEMQNSTESQMKMILTRISFGSKLIINGDLNQSDNRRNGLKDFLNKYEHSKDPNKDNIKIVKFRNSDVQRHSIIETVLNIYE